MKKVGMLVMCLMLVWALVGCDVQDAEPQVSSAAEIGELLAEEVAGMAEGEVLDIEVTPELREHYFKVARLEDWFHMPSFAAGEQPTHPLDYWIMILQEGAVGWDETYGWTIVDSPWELLNDPSMYLYNGMPVVPVDEFDAFVRTHFGDVTVAHEVCEGKYYAFDGENYYSSTYEGTPPGHYGLSRLQVELVDGRPVYTASVNQYQFNEYNYFVYNEDRTFEENKADYDSSLHNGHSAYSEIVVLDAYGDQLLAGEITMDQAIRQMVIDGNTGDFIVWVQQTVRYYIDEANGEPVYLEVLADHIRDREVLERDL